MHFGRDQVSISTILAASFAVMAPGCVNYLNEVPGFGPLVGWHQSSHGEMAGR